MSTQLDPLIGSEIDGYLIEKLLGKGGMARVYRGQEVHLGRYVAVKVIEPQSRTDPQYAMRFQKEGRAVAQLQHPHIVSIYRFGEVSSLFYMVMQYIDGTDLGWVLRDYARDTALMPYEDVLAVISQVGSALDYAHSKGVIHRDIKPANVMLDKEGRAIVTDFGLALVQTEGTHGEIFGTPHYIAPEQAVSSAGAVPQSDQYSLGVMLYEMLTGGVPYDSTSAMDIALAHMTEPLPSPLEGNPDLPLVFVPVLEKVLQKEPGNRYPSCSAFAADLQQAIQASKHQASTISRLSMLGVSEQVKAFRAANPLPPLPAPVAAPAAPQEQKAAPADITRRVTPPSTVIRPANPRKNWAVATIAATAVVIIGLIAVAALLTGNNGQTPTPTAVSISASELPQIAGSTTPIPLDVLPLATLPDTAVALVATDTPLIPTALTTLSVPLPTATELTIYFLTVLTQGEDSLFVINASEKAFPLEPLRLGDSNGAISGTEWGIAMLESAACVAIWKDSGNPQSPSSTCNQVGQRVTRDGPNRFWKSSFNAYYNDRQVGTCNPGSCSLTIIPSG